MTPEDKATEIVKRIHDVCDQYNAAPTEGQIYEALIEIYEWTKQSESLMFHPIIEQLEQEKTEQKKMIDGLLDAVLQSLKNYNELLKLKQ